jgi:pimeloyl-ACP methyl ester carboxylesterase
MQRRTAHQTKQIGAGPIEGVAMLPAPPGVELVSYASNGLALKGWLIKPEAASNQPGPGVVYLHNNFSLTMRSYNNALAFVDAGFTVFLPTWRAENGNPGDFELLYGEVDDAKAAIAWFAARPDILPDSVYAIGHSIGGGIAALLSLHPDQQARVTASVGGIYRARTFWFWANRSSTRNLIRFDPLDATEVTLRLLGPNVRDMANRHIAYAGENDEFDTAYALHVGDLASEYDAPYEVVLVSGDHMSSIDQSIQHFIGLIRMDMER